MGRIEERNSAAKKKFALMLDVMASIGYSRLRPAKVFSLSLRESKGCLQGFFQ
jgi:hypothetical protein